ncbi:hypothetical protein JOD64_003495 [Micromonospora luteifusca]|uniref:Class F sortase n=1 Tax=Micromonospora luteifusca TaxID=709860 RepID=A0ABS2LVS5_9ACTN|nr:hypothetical protein [Micromonospora luteifusca]MBM7492273.1 hypothetical protein [Micromonospora luteifusca]
MDEHQTMTERSAPDARAWRVADVVAALVATTLAVGLTHGWDRADQTAAAPSPATPSAS